MPAARSCGWCNNFIGNSAPVSQEAESPPGRLTLLLNQAGHKAIRKRLPGLGLRALNALQTIVLETNKPVHPTDSKKIMVRRSPRRRAPCRPCPPPESWMRARHGRPMRRAGPPPAAGPVWGRCHRLRSGSGPCADLQVLAQRLGAIEHRRRRPGLPGGKAATQARRTPRPALRSAMPAA